MESHAVRILASTWVGTGRAMPGERGRTPGGGLSGLPLNADTSRRPPVASATLWPPWALVGA
jgi:hypothetical protein